MLDTIRLATISDYDATWQLYTDVCAAQKHNRYGADWKLGVYPAEQDVRRHIEEGELYVGLLDGQVVAAMVLVLHEDPEYASIPWPAVCADDEVAVIHLLAVHPLKRGMHLGSELVREAIRLARAMGKRAIHLDVLPGNLAAQRIYLQEGFVFVGTYQIFYEDTGLADFDMLECVL